VVLGGGEGEIAERRLPARRHEAERHRAPLGRPDLERPDGERDEIGGQRGRRGEGEGHRPPILGDDSLRLRRVGDDDVALRRRDAKIERDLERGLVETGERRASIDGLELREGVRGVSVADAIEAGELIPEGSGVRDADLRRAGRDGAGEGEDELVGLARPARGARGHLDRDRSPTDEGVGAENRELAPVEHHSGCRRRNRQVDRDVAFEPIFLGVDDQGDGVVGGTRRGRESTARVGSRNPDTGAPCFAAEPLATAVGVERGAATEHEEHAQREREAVEPGRRCARQRTPVHRTASLAAACRGGASNPSARACAGPVSCRLHNTASRT
jgi:hypothetical protein